MAEPLTRCYEREDGPRDPVIEAFVFTLQGVPGLFRHCFLRHGETNPFFPCEEWREVIQSDNLTVRSREDDEAGTPDVMVTWGDAVKGKVFIEMRDDSSFGVDDDYRYYRKVCKRRGPGYLICVGSKELMQNSLLKDRSKVGLTTWSDWHHWITEFYDAGDDEWRSTREAILVQDFCELLVRRKWICRRGNTTAAMKIR
jgi:hypothetical protein